VLPQHGHAVGTPSCAAVIVTAPADAEGQVKRPRSSRLAKRHMPWPSCHRIFYQPTTPSAKYKKPSAVRIALALLLHQDGRAIKASPHVGMARRQATPGRQPETAS